MGHRWLFFPDSAPGGGGGGGGGGGSDPCFANVILLLPFDGEDDDADVLPFKKDYSPEDANVLINSLAKADITPKWGTTSLWHLTTNNDSAQVTTNPNIFTFLGKSWSIEMWIRWANDADRDKFNDVTWRRRTFFSLQRGTGQQISAFAYKPFISAPNLIYEWRTDDSVDHTLVGGGLLASGGWHHVAVERADDDILRIFHNGTVVASTNVSGQVWDTDGSRRVWIGQQDNSASSFMNGWIDDVRVTLDKQRWGASFDPPTEAHPLS